MYAARGAVRAPRPRAPPEREGARVPPERGSAPVQPREVEAVPPVGQEEIRVLALELAEELDEQLLLGALEVHRPERERADCVVGADDPVAPAVGELDGEFRARQRRRGVLEQLGRLGRRERRAGPR